MTLTGNFLPNKLRQNRIKKGDLFVIIRYIAKPKKTLYTIKMRVLILVGLFLTACFFSCRQASNEKNLQRIDNDTIPGIAK